MRLAELERFFAAAATSGAGPLPGLEGVFVSSDALSASERLAIYNRGYYYRLLDALAAVFVETRRALGPAEFERVGLSYLERYPSEHPAVERVGRRFAQFLNDIQAGPEFLVDLATLEWARLTVLVAPDPRHVASPHDLAPAEFAQARVRFVPALHCLALAPNTIRVLAGEPWVPGSANERVGVVVWRARHTVRQAELQTEEFQALQSAIGGATLAQVCAHFDTGDAAADTQRAFQALSAWFARHWLESLVFHGA